VGSGGGRHGRGVSGSARGENGCIEPSGVDGMRCRVGNSNLVDGDAGDSRPAAVCVLGDLALAREKISPPDVSSAYGAISSSANTK
jgi:hypothetical protein